MHDLHVWNLCSEHIALSAHVVLKRSHADKDNSVLQDLRNRLDGRFEIRHTTLQFEDSACGEAGGCNSTEAHPEYSQVAE